jgi:maleylacetoacetate isomerase
MYNARRFSVPLEGFPLLTRVEAEALAHSAFAAAHPDRVAPPA